MIAINYGPLSNECSIERNAHDPKVLTSSSAGQMVSVIEDCYVIRNIVSACCTVVEDINVETGRSGTRETLEEWLGIEFVPRSVRSRPGVNLACSSCLHDSSASP